MGRNTKTTAPKRDAAARKVAQSKPSAHETVETILDASTVAVGIAQAPHAPAVAARERAPQAADSLAGVTRQFGARHWAANPTFEWARDFRGHRMRFTRWYMDQHVLVDVFQSASVVDQKEAVAKREAIARENARREAMGQPAIGYLPVVRGALIGIDAFERVKRGEVLDIIDRVPEGIRA